MKKAIAILALLGTVSTGLVQAAEPDADMSAQPSESKLKYFSPERKAQRAQDRALAKKVRIVLEKKKGLDMSDVTILARDGKVTLAGTMPDTNQIQLAGNSATGVNGVQSLTNDLGISYPGH
jgi:hyperosmotically inducible periplasmic protein